MFPSIKLNLINKNVLQKISITKKHVISLLQTNNNKIIVKKLKGNIVYELQEIYKILLKLCLKLQVYRN